ncbi:MAG: DNA-3-methyladenine glycosylase family protein [Candidatus Bathyarchaeia archaeon]|jgi:DNA-3-methyladenine glycosylase II
MTQTETITIEPLAPFDLPLSSLVFAAGDKKVRGYQNGCFSQVVDADGRLVYAKLTEEGHVDKPKLMLELQSDGALSVEEKRKAHEVISYIFSLNVPLNPFYQHIQTDPVMTKIVQKLRGFKFPTTPTVFESLVDAIVEQQISIKVARSIEERLAVMFGDSVTVDGETFYAFPTADALAKAGTDKIRQAGLSMRKADYIFGAAQLMVDDALNLEQLKTRTPEEIIGKLDAIRGIGVWTAELTLLRGMQRFDVLPADDFGIRRVISRYYCRGKPIKAAEARQIAEAWGNWKGLAAFYLIIAEAQNITF